ncbi:MAG: DUF4132 domain-containing protein, partial [Planctomycetota bacterium]
MIGRSRKRRKDSEESYPDLDPLLTSFLVARGDNAYRRTPEIDAAMHAILESTPERQAVVLVQMVGKNLADYGITSDLMLRLFQRKLPLTQEELARLVRWSNRNGSLGHVLKSVERVAAHETLETVLEEALHDVQQGEARMYRPQTAQRKIHERIAKLLGEEAPIKVYVDPDFPMTARIAVDLEQFDDIHRQPMMQLLAHAQSASGAKPSRKWTSAMTAFLELLPNDLVASAIQVWFSLFDKPITRPLENEWQSEWSVSEASADLVKGLLWATASLQPDESLIRAISALGLSSQRKIAGVGPRCIKVTNAAVWALSAIDHQLAIAQLAILRSRIRNRTTQKQIDKAMAAVAERLGVSEEEVSEIAVPTFGFDEVGVIRTSLAGFTATLTITGTSSTTLQWIKPDGKTQKSVPKAVKDEHAEEVKELKAAAKDVEKYLPSQRDRLDRMHLRRKPWQFETWTERYLHQPIVGSLVRRLIWSITDGDRTYDATWDDSATALVDVHGSPIGDVSRDADVTLWHPIGKDTEQTLAWRSYFEEREIQQPFKQAHREIYVLTDAERTTRVYSNRFAAHIIKQHQFNALCAVRGWRNQLRLMVDDEYEPATKDLPEWGIRAEFWIEGIGDGYGVDTTETGTYHFLATDQVRFYDIDALRLTAHAGGGGYGTYQQVAPDPLPIEDIPPLVLSEVLRDVDLFVGVASVGNDPTWADGQENQDRRAYWSDFAFGDLSVAAQERRSMLERLVPRLKIADRCTFSDRFLHVRGDKRTYKIHMGSGNIQMEPNDQYLCIVAGRGAISGPAAKVFLPFEGDRTLSIILS